MRQQSCETWLDFKKSWRNNYSTRQERTNIKYIKASIIKIEHYKIPKLISNSTVSEFVTKRWIEVNNLSRGQYAVNKIISFEVLMLRSDLCDYRDGYIIVKGRITLEGDNDGKTGNKMLILLNK